MALTRRATALYGVAAVCVVIALAFMVFRPRPAEPAAPAFSKEPVITHSTDKPSESKAEAGAYNWRGSAKEPKKIAIPQFDIDAYIQKSGVDQNKQVAVPNNVHLASWFADSVLPGGKGLSVIAGHVSGVSQPGVFGQLGKLQKNDEFTITLGDNTLKTFQVMSVTSVPTKEAANLLFSQDPDTKSQLNLITCTGSYNTKERSYDRRVIVAARLKS